MMKENKEFYTILFKTILNTKFYLSLLLSLVGAGLSLVLPKVIGSLIEPKTLKYLQTKPTLILCLILACLAVYVIQALSTYFLANAGINAMNEMQRNIHGHLLNSYMLDLNQFQAGDLASRLTNDISSISNITAVIFPKLFLDSLVILGTVIILLRINLSITLLGLTLLPLITLVIWPINKKLESEYIVQQNFVGQISSQVTHNFLHIPLIKAFLGEDRERESLNFILKGFSRNFKKIISLSIFQDTFVSTVTMSAVVLILIFANSLVLNRELTVAMLATYLLYLIQLIEPLTAVSNGLTQISEFRAAKKRLADILSLKEEALELDNEGDKLIESDISFANVSFSYDKDKVLSNITFNVKAGHHLAIIGPSGCGKSTILNLLLKFNDNYLGSIKIGGRELREISFKTLRDHISYIPQENPMFRGTLRSNLLYGKNTNVSENRLNDVLRILNLTEVIQNFQNGLDTVISDFGSGISEGQKQRFNIARALLKESDIYLLDEVTSNLDGETEKKITEAIDTLTKNKTRITVAHRLETVKGADWMLLLDENGRMIKSGPYDDLIVTNPNKREYLSPKIIAG